MTISLRSTTFRRQHLLTAEGQQLARKRRGALCGAGDFLSGTAKLRVGSHAFEQKFRITRNHHQQVIEVVRDTACEPSDGFHLLRLTQLLFEGAALGDVLGKYSYVVPSLGSSIARPDIRAARVVPSLRTHSATRPRVRKRVSWATHRRSRGGTRRARVDAAASRPRCAGRALVESATCPDSSHAIEAAFVARWPRLKGIVAWEERDIADVTASGDDLVVSVHACGRLTNRVIDIALAARAPVAVLPCCQSLAKCETAGLHAWLEGRLAIDVVRAMRLREAGYAVKLQHILRGSPRRTA